MLSGTRSRGRGVPAGAVEHEHGVRARAHAPVEAWSSDSMMKPSQRLSLSDAWDMGCRGFQMGLAGPPATGLLPAGPGHRPKRLAGARRGGTDRHL